VLEALGEQMRIMQHPTEETVVSLYGRLTEAEAQQDITRLVLQVDVEAVDTVRVVELEALQQ
jgi:hypothetical protein